MRAFIISSINPRLVIYSRPLLLALCIGLVTVATTTGMFLFLLSSCTRTRDKQAFTQLGVKDEHTALFAIDRMHTESYSRNAPITARNTDS